MKNKTIFRRITALLLAAVLWGNYNIPVTAHESAHSDIRKSITSLSDYPSNEIIVKYKGNSNSDHLLSALSVNDYTEVTPLDDNFGLITVDSKKELQNTLNLLAQDKNVAYIQPNYTYKLMLACDTALISSLKGTFRLTTSGTDEPDFPKQWGLHNDGTFKKDNVISKEDVDINAPEAWETFQNGRETIVAVIDTGIDYTHPNLVDSMWVNKKEIPEDGIDNDKNGLVDDINGWNFYSSNNILYEKNSKEDNHGTHCAGTIAASANGTGIAGIASNTNVKIMSLKALGGEDGTGTTASVINAIAYAASMGASICNLSCGMTESRDAALGDAIKNSSMLFVSAAGNGNGLTMSYNNDVKPTYPASYEYSNIISVANIRCDGKLHALSNYGIESVDIAAPGTGIYSTHVGGGYAYMTGTSMSAPMVTGVAALIYSRFKQVTPIQVKEVILNTARPLDSLTGKVSTGGMVDAYAAVTADVVSLLSLDVIPPKIKTNVASISNSYKKKLNIHITDKENTITVAYAKGKKKTSYFDNGQKGSFISLNANGNVSLTISSSGTYSIYAIDSVGNEQLTTVTVSIKKPTKVSMLSTKKLKVGQVYPLKAVLTPKSSTSGVTYTSSNSNIVSVNKTTGKITAKKKGTATINVKTENNLTATCKIICY